MGSGAEAAAADEGLVGDRVLSPAKGASGESPSVPALLGELPPKELPRVGKISSILGRLLVVGGVSADGAMGIGELNGAGEDVGLDTSAVAECGGVEITGGTDVFGRAGSGKVAPGAHLQLHTEVVPGCHMARSTVKGKSPLWVNGMCNVLMSSPLSMH